MKTYKATTGAFTRIDLLALTAMLVVLATLTSAALGKAALDANGEGCLNHMRQLTRAIHLYAADYDDYLPPNTEDGSISSWLSQTEGSPGPDSTNYSRLVNPASNKLAPYLHGDPTVFKCPSDTSTVTIGAQKIPRVRSISLNHAVGTNPTIPGGKTPTDGAWLDGSHGHTANKTWRCYARTADVVHPTPAGLFIFADEHPAGINDGNIAFQGPSPTANYHWIDWPAHYHNGGGGFGFMDGHAEIHIWQDVATLADPYPTSSAGSVHDLAWLANRTSALVADQP